VAEKDTKRERREASRKARMEAQRKAARRKQLRRVYMVVAAIVVVALIVGLVYLSGADTRKAREELVSLAAAAGCSVVQNPASEGAGHLTAEEEAAKTQVEYKTEPPTSGKHSGSTGPTSTGVHSSPVPDEDFVHNLEHGHIGVFYDPATTPAAVVDALERWVRDDDQWRFVTPRSELAAKTVQVAFASWGHDSTCAAPTDEDALVRFAEAFAKVYVRGGPETVPGTPG
jgi:hypothetical protein